MCRLGVGRERLIRDGSIETPFKETEGWLAHCCAYLPSLRFLEWERDRERERGEASTYRPRFGEGGAETLRERSRLCPEGEDSAFSGAGASLSFPSCLRSEGVVFASSEAEASISLSEAIFASYLIHCSDGGPQSF